MKKGYAFMDKNRRKFLSGLTKKAATVTAAVTSPTLAYADSFTEELKKL